MFFFLSRQLKTILAASHKFSRDQEKCVPRGKQIDAALLLGDWDLASRGLEGLLQHLKFGAKVPLALRVLAIAIKIKRGQIKGKRSEACNLRVEADNGRELQFLHTEVLRMRQEEPSLLQVEKEKYEHSILIQAKRVGTTEKELEAFYQVVWCVF